MQNKKLLFVFGTRPEAIKMLPLVLELKKHKEFDCKVCITAQHREMLDQVLEIFDVKSDYDLDIMKNRQSLSDITVGVLEGMDKVLEKEKPDMILVHGDTSTTFVAALSAFYKQISVAHIEAGLRSYNKYEPFPEEMNRLLTTQLSDLYFAPTQTAKNALLKENYGEDSIFVTGNTVIDAFHTTLKENYTYKNAALNKLDIKNKKIVLITAHRRENLGEGIENICKAVLDLQDKYKDLDFIYPVHKNPAVRDSVYPLLENLDRVHLLEPIDVDDMHNLMKDSYIILSDSGGIQEEAPAVDKPLLVCRNITERTEGIKAGAYVLVGTDIEKIVKNVDKLILDKEYYEKMSVAKNPFGDGKASKRIADALLYHYNFTNNRPQDFK